MTARQPLGGHQHRRALLAGIGAATALAAVPATAGNIGDDRDLVALFERWNAAVRALRDAPGEMPEEEYRALYDATDEMEEELRTAVPASLTGLAVKLRVNLAVQFDYEHGYATADGMEITDDMLIDWQDAFARQLLRDCERLAGRA